MIEAVLKEQTSIVWEITGTLAKFEDGLQQLYEDTKFWKERENHIINAEEFMDAIYNIAVLTRNCKRGEIVQRGTELRHRIENSFQPVNFTTFNSLRKNINSFLQEAVVKDKRNEALAENRTQSLFAFF